ncbi:MAG: GlsB/YeaQ/YmgE family stress response membrane protein [Hyphomicrobium sp.]|nr:GlsB/YeaQ/YmgE family stress response membrane protein [Hyphomicrobium sp.]
MDYLNNPWVIMLVNGLIAGWLAGLLLGGGGLIRNLFVGIIGAFLAGVLIKAGLLTLPFTTGFPLGDQIIVSTVGAILVIIIARVIAR